MKKVLVLGIIVLSIFLIYLCNMDKKVYYLALGDKSLIGDENGYSYFVKDYLKDKSLLEKYVGNFIHEDYLTYDLFKNIQDNEMIVTDNKKITIQNALIKADLVTLSVGQKDILNKINVLDPDYNEIYNYIDELSVDLDKLFKLMRQYCKEDIVMVGYYNPGYNDEKIKSLFDYLNKKYEEVSLKYDIHYIRIDHIFSENPQFLENNYPNKMGYKAIAGEIIGTINKTTFKA